MNTPTPPKRMVIAIDGPAAAGKGTLARRLAAALNLPYLDTGLLYRATARRLLNEGARPTDPDAAMAVAATLTPADMARPDLRTPDVDRAAADVASLPPVRAALLDFQRRFGRESGAVLDGRDIGTVIFPNADVKLFVTASVEARAGRRFAERQARGEPITYQEVLDDQRARDAQDAARAAAPLRAAEDAVLLDTTNLNPDQAFTRALEIVHAKCQSPNG